MNSSYQLLHILIPIITAPYISRVLGAEGIGIYAFTNSIVVLFGMFATFGSATYGNREIAYHQNDKKKRSEIFWEINFLSWITTLLSYGVFLIFVILSNHYQIIYLWQGFFILASVFDISWYFMGMEKFKIIVGRNFIIKLLSVICIFAFVHRPSDLIIYVAIGSVSVLLANLSLWPYLINEVEAPRIKSSHLLRHLRYIILLFIPTAALNISSIANKYLIGIFSSVTQAGFYNQSDNIIRMTLSLVGTLSIVMLPRVANMHAQGEAQGVRNLIIRTFNIATALACGLYFGISGISIHFAAFFFGKPFEMVGVLILIEAPIILFITWSGILGTQYLLPLNRMKIYTVSVTIGSFLNILFNFLLIPHFGAKGSVIATVLAELFIVIYQYWNVRKELLFSNLIKGTWKYFVAGFIMFLVVFWMNQTFTMTALQLILQIFVGGLIYAVLNIILKTQFWEMVLKLLHKKKNESVYENL